MRLTRAQQRDELLLTLRAVLRDAGGVAKRTELIEATSRVTVDRAVADGALVGLRRGLLASPEVGEAVGVALAAGGVLSLTSAALQHGWAVKTVPTFPHVTLAKGRRTPPGIRAVWHRAAWGPGETMDGIVTSKEVTLTQCLRMLPFDEALAIADSALRAGEVGLLRAVARQARGPGAPRIRRVAALATDLAANPFESVLRAICLGVPGLDVRPQAVVTDVEPWVRPDLVDETLRIVIEADSFEWHGGRAELKRDARRYNDLVAADWRVLRFPYEDVMFDPARVRTTLRAAVERAQKYTEGSRRPKLTLVSGAGSLR